MQLILFKKYVAISFQKSDYQYRLSFALKIFCVLFLNMPMALSAEALQKMCHHINEL
jgi:hypothetical protein